MHNYDSMKKTYGNSVSQTIDGPITFLDFWDLWDLGMSLIVILLFGIIFYSWWTMILLLSVTIFIAPSIKRKNERGIFFHWMYRHLGLELPAMINPKGRNKFSD